MQILVPHFRNHPRLQDNFQSKPKRCLASDSEVVTDRYNVWTVRMTDGPMVLHVACAVSCPLNLMNNQCQLLELHRKGKRRKGGMIRARHGESNQLEPLRQPYPHLQNKNPNRSQHAPSNERAQKTGLTRGEHNDVACSHVRRRSNQGKRPLVHAMPKPRPNRLIKCVETPARSTQSLQNQDAWYPQISKPSRLIVSLDVATFVRSILP